jgi:hypothetical protein
MTTAGNEAWVDLHTVTHLGHREQVTRIRQRFGVRVVRAGGVSFGSAVITARLESWDGRSSVRLNGRPITSVPMTVDAHAEVGTTKFYDLEIEVPTTVADGPLSASIEWEVTTE